ncbi:MAG: hypothetical protein HN474_04145 [Nitrospina sp.]|nr:hypothetical protein [Nitrospina sp.]
MATPKYIEFLNATGADIDANQQSPKVQDTSEQLNISELKAHIAKGLPSTMHAEVDDLPFKIKTTEWEWQEIEGVGKFPKNYKPDFLGFD